jgi:hypothetical protein
MKHDVIDHMTISITSKRVTEEWRWSFITKAK